MESRIEPDKAVDDVARVVIGAAIEVHKHLGPGYLESVYEQALAIELELREVPFKCQHAATVRYKGITVGEGRVDLLVADRLVVELKAVETLLPIHKAQVISYLRGTGLSLGLLINFNARTLREGIQRIVYTL